MSTHYLHLHPEPFEYISLGKKAIESRLFDEKRRTYKIGDNLVFINRANKQERIEAVVFHLHKAPSFRDLFLERNLKGKFGTDSLEELLVVVRQYYSE
jgi:ASC-1-like (ASCH) protein